MSDLERAFRHEVRCVLDNMHGDNMIEEEKKKKLDLLTEKDIKEIAETIIYDNYIWSEINEMIESEIFKKIN